MSPASWRGPGCLTVIFGVHPHAEGRSIWVVRASYPIGMSLCSVRELGTELPQESCVLKLDIIHCFKLMK